MRVRVVDYIGNLGGGIRFVVETLRALLRVHPGVELEFTAYGEILDRYRHAAAREDLRMRFSALRPGQRSRVPAWFPRIGRASDWHVEVPAAVFDGPDVVWFPWIHRHRLPTEGCRKVVGTFHDATFFQIAGLIPDSALADERRTIEGWLTSEAEIVVGSRTTLRAVSEIFGAASDRLRLIRVAGRHAPLRQGAAGPVPWAWASGPFLLYAANTFPHKNHEVLLEGLALWGAKRPLVLTGWGTDLASATTKRAARLRRHVRALGLTLGRDVIGLGYLEDETYFSLLSRASLLTMASLAEGGGSFPVMEAMLAGVPVLCADIPVMREQIEQTGGEPVWFDPTSPTSLAEQLSEIEAEYGRVLARARQQAAALRVRSWTDVATEYVALFEAASSR
jgi:glycosyltransferase involved in cell wall biosynthesis